MFRDFVKHYELNMYYYFKLITSNLMFIEDNHVKVNQYYINYVLQLQLV